MPLKSILPAIFILSVHLSAAQKIIFSDGFEKRELDSAWQIVNGNWRIADVQQLRIAPAENGYQYVLCSGGKGYIGGNIIRLRIDLPDTTQASKIKLSFSYYIHANAPGTTVEAEFHKKYLKDGLKGKIWTADLPVKRRWATLQKLLKIPAGAQYGQHRFFGLESSGKTERTVCFDNVVISSLR